MKELGIKGKSKDKGTGKGFSIDHDALVALSSSANLSTMSKEDKAKTVEKHISVSDEKQTTGNPQD